MLQIDGDTFPVDLTWDSGRMQNGEKELQYFGCKKDFFLTHNQERDEKQYNYVCLLPEFINKIDTNNVIKKRNLSKEDKRDIIQNAIEETYKKFKLSQGSQIAKDQVNTAIINYIKKGQTTNFTRQNNARDCIEKYISREDMIDVLIDEYVRNTELLKNNGIESNDVLRNAIQETSNKYGNEQASKALKKFILENNVDRFTRQNNARSNIQNFMLPQLALEKIIEEMVEREIDSIEITTQLSENNTQILQKMYFDGGEFAQVQLPVEKEKKLIKKAAEWIKRKTIERRQSNNREYKNEYIEKEEKSEQNQRE